ncbi:polysaccharide pyruvyl transferase family protein [Cellulomonas sp. NPDC057328]|uniref:polysaccharide pyruvyl transferase family protein n=1 Tax=Cellulomonas sp. NPDC057328 TaxID=3346101 RepID=UPI00362C525D
MARVLVLHAYSAQNAGDGFLVDATVDLVREALGDVDITVVASRPESFTRDDVRFVCSQPGRRGYQPQYVRTLRGIGGYDLVVAVGGGYQRAGHLVEALKAGLVHGPQLVAASRRGTGVVYLPQSIGPLRGPSAPLVSRLLQRVDAVYVRDDRSMAEVARARPRRSPDLAISVGTYRPRRPETVVDVPVLSVRNLRGALPEPVQRLAGELAVFDGYVQSRVGGNDDTSAMTSLRPRRIVDRDELLGGGTPRRVVVAMRLHGALMAMQAGHYVVHLAYERKGYGAFADLGLDDYVVGATRLVPHEVAERTRALLTDPTVREDYDRCLLARLETMPSVRAGLVDELRAAAARRGAAS